MANAFHITDVGPKPCKAIKKPCPIGGEHFSHEEEAYAAYAANFEETALSSFKKEGLIELSSNIGTAMLVDGDLSDPRARAILSSGLCGDLALAIHRETGGAPYFLSYSVSDPDELVALFEKDPDSVIYQTNHVLIESPTKPNHFVDAYGQSGYEELEENWDGAYVVEGTVAMLEHFAAGSPIEKFKNFAAAAIKLDKEEVWYELDEDMLDFD